MLLEQTHDDEDIFGFTANVLVDPAAPTQKAALPKNLCLAKAPTEFDKIEQKDKNILLYFWTPSRALCDQIAATDVSELPVSSLTVETDTEWLSAIEQTEHPLITLVLKEMREALTSFSNLTPTKKLTVAFLKAFDRPCPLFHVDSNHLRLICTLRGPGTEWLANKSVNRNRLGTGSNRKVVKPEAIVQQLAPFQIAVMKGDKYPGNYRSGVVHRSPGVPEKVGVRWFIRVDVK